MPANPAAPGCPPPDADQPSGFDARLAAARAAVAALAGAAGKLAEVPDDGLGAVMGELTTLAGQIDGLRVAVTAQVRDRGIFRQQGAASVTRWLHADPRVADEAWALSQLAARAGELPKVTGLLRTGAASLAQAGAACWQIAHLPDTVTRPQGDDDLAALTDPQPGDDLWAGLWRAGDVHAAADELFSEYLPRLDGAGLRMLGAHLREAADAQERAGEDYDAFTRRAVRLSRSLGGVGELSGRLHPEAAGQVLAAFEELGGKAGPDDDRTKVQRWADVLVYLASLAGIAPAGTSPAGSSPPGADPAAAGPSGADPDPGAEDDQPCGDGGHGHEPPSAGSGDATAGDQAGAPGRVPAGLARRPRVIVTVPLATLLGQPLAPGAVLGAGIPITTETARRLACDAEIIRLITSPLAQPPSVGPPGDGGPPSGGPPSGGPPSGVGDLDVTATGELASLLAAAIGQLPRPLGGPSAALDIGRASQSWTPRQRDALYALYGGRCGAP
ncbi:MAG TPA: hypothetical protein VGM53_26940, partial [Streptosporangiaceae bacterium]